MLKDVVKDYLDRKNNGQLYSQRFNAQHTAENAEVNKKI